MKIVRVAEYLRYSSEMQRDSLSIEGQHDVNVKFCAAKSVNGENWQIVEAYKDEAQSASTTNRPDFRRMMTDARAGKFDVIVVYKIDRFSRSITDTLLTLRELEGWGVSFASASEQFDFTTPGGKMMMVILTLLAETFLDNLSADTTRGKRINAERGYTNGNIAPLGYFLDKKELKKSPDNEAVAEAFENYSTGEWSDATIAKFLTQKTGQFVSTDSAAAILRNPVYAGFVVYRGMVKRGMGRNPKRQARLIPGRHEATVSQELFDRVQTVRRKRRTHSGAPPKRIYLLGKLARCSVCGSPLRAKAITDRDYALSYRCTAHERGVECSASQSPVREAHLMPQLDALMQTLTMPPEVIDAALAALRNEDKSAEIAAKKAALESEKARVAHLYKIGLISEKQLDADAERIKSELSSLAIQPVTVSDEAAAILQNLYGLWQKADRRQKAHMLRLLLDGVAVDTTKKQIAAYIPHEDFAAIFRAVNLIPL